MAPPSDPLLPNNTRPKPSWPTWINDGRAQIWEAVALACDIHPPAIDRDSASDKQAQDLAQFWDRHGTALRGANDRKLALVDPCAPIVSVIGDYSLCSVDLSVFVRWAQSLPCPWELPEGFPGRSDVDWSIWGKIETEELWRVVAISLGISPDGKTLEDAELFSKEFKDRLRVALNCLSESLPVVTPFSWPESSDQREFFRQHGQTPPRERSTVCLAKFATWATGKGYAMSDSFPREKAHVHEAPKVEDKKAIPADLAGDQKALGTRERNSLYMIVVGLAKAKGYDLTHPSAAGEAIAADVKAAGHVMDPKTISNHLQAAIKALDGKRTKGK